MRRRRGAWTGLPAAVGVVVGITLATSGGNVLASEVEPNPVISVGSSDKFAEEAVEPAVVAQPHPTTPVRERDTTNGLRFFFRRSAVFVIAGVVFLVRMGLRSAFRRR